MITSTRENRAAIDDIMWDNRPPHYAPDTPNEYAHLFVSPEAQGPAITTRDTVYPGFQQIDTFSAGCGPECSHKKTLDMLKLVLLFIIVAILSYLVADWRIKTSLSIPAVAAAPPVT